MLLKETPFVEVVHYCDAQVLLIRWKEHASDSDFRTTYLDSLAYAASNQPLKFFCTDLTLIGSLRREQEVWLSLEFYKDVYSAIKDTIYVAIVFSEEHFKALVINYQLPADTQQHDFMQFNYFTSQQEAWCWLDSLKKGQDTALLPLALNL